MRLQLFAWPIRTIHVVFGYWLTSVWSFVEALAQQQLVALVTAQGRQVDRLTNKLHTVKQHVGEWVTFLLKGMTCWRIRAEFSRTTQPSGCASYELCANYDLPKLISTASRMQHSACDPDSDSDWGCFRGCAISSSLGAPFWMYHK